MTALLAELLQGRPRRLVISCGPAGGGELIAEALLAHLGVARSEVDSHLLEDEHGTHIRHVWPEGQIRDYAHGSGLAPRAVPAHHGDDDDTVTITLVRERHAVDSGDPEHLDLRSAGPAAVELFTELATASCAIPESAARALAVELGCATALIPELSHLGAKLQSEETARGTWRSLPTVLELYRDVNDRGGRRLLDLCRVLSLLRPPEIELGDEWAVLATALSGRVYSVADINLVLSQFPGLFAVRDAGGQRFVRVASPLAAQLMLGDAPPSASEHFALFRALRDRAVHTLSRTDSADAFVAEQLPRQAIAATAMEELTTDPLAVLCSDPFSLLHEIESGSELPLSRAATVTMLCAHRLLESSDRASHLELSARRHRLDAFAATLAETLPARRWRPLWARSRPANVHRVLLSHDSAVLAVRAVGDGEPGVAFAGCSDGAIWRLHLYERPRRLAATDGAGAEARALAVSRWEGRTYVAAGMSDHAVQVLDGADGTRTWRDETTHSNPLSALAIDASCSPPLLASAGVDGDVWCHDLVSGAPVAGPLHRHGSEVRGLVFLRLEGVRVLALCSVTGWVRVIAVDSGEQLLSWHVGAEVLNAIVARVDAGTLTLVVGAISGRVVHAAIGLGLLGGEDPSLLRGDGLPVGARVEEVARHAEAINDIAFVDGAAALASASSDGSWSWTGLADERRRVAHGHVAPAWAIDALAFEDRRYLLSGGGEGACRLWPIDAVLAEGGAQLAPQGMQSAVTSVVLAPAAAQELQFLTGTRHGEVRAFARDEPGAGTLLTQHDGEVASMLVWPESDGPEQLQLVSGSRDGTLRVTHVEHGEPTQSSVLGIAHEGVTALASGPLDGTTALLSGGLDGTVTLWDMATRTPRTTLRACRFGGVLALCPSSERGVDGFLVGGQDGTVSLRTGPRLEERRASSLEASVLCLSPLPVTCGEAVAGLADGRVAVIEQLGLEDRGIRFIDVSRSELRAITTMSFRGTTVVACAGLDRQLRLIHLGSGEVLLEVELDGYIGCLSVHGVDLALGTSAGALALTFPSELDGRGK